MTADTLGVVFTRANEHGKAVAMFSRAVELFPQHATFRFNLATSLTFAGRLEEAEREYEACLSRNPHYWKAHLALAKLRKTRPDNHHLVRLRGLLAAMPAADWNGLMYVNLALAAELEDLHQDAEAFKHLVAGKQIGGRGRAGSSTRDTAVFEALRAAFPNRIPQELIGSDNAEPIFIVGMPRSGTTLVDRILSSHSLVHSAGELQNFGVILKRASASTTPELLDVDCIRRASQLPWKQLGDAYVASTRPGTGHTPRFIDKLPHNFLYLGHIARALPQARIVCMRRNPMDTCLGNFRQLFAQSTSYYDYSFDLLDTGRYYLQFDALMQHWQEVLPGRILEVHYEALVDTPDATVQALLAHCGLPWEDACLHFHDNAAPVATASAVQVREPLHRGALHRWKRFEPQLQPLRELLEQGGIEI
jgi:tetratricopeptide (TPR) repeat protein